jgi:WD40 repeat protein
VVLYQMVVGDFGRALAPGWERRVEDELLREEIAACVDGSPQRRRSSTLQIAENLRSLEERRQARDNERRKRERSRRARRLRRVSTVALVLFTMVAGLMGLLWWRSEVARQDATAAATRAEAVQLRALGQAQLDTYPTAALAYSIASLEQEDTPASRLLALRALWRGPPCFMASESGDYWQVAFSPDGRYLASGDSLPLSESGNTIWRDDGAQLPITFGASYHSGAGRFSWGGSRAFAPSSDALLTYNPITNIVYKLSSVPSGETLFEELVENHLDHVWLNGPDGDRLRWATRAKRKAVVVDWLVARKEKRPIATIELGTEIGLWRFSADGRWLVGALQRELRALPVLPGTGQDRSLGHLTAEIIDLARHPKEPLFATVDGSNKLQLWPVGQTEGEPERILVASSDLERVGFGGGGSVVLAGKDDRWVAWRLDDLTAVNVKLTGRATDPDVDPSAQYVAVPFLDETIRIWDLDGPPAAEPVTLQRGQVLQMNCVAFHRSGRWLASADNGAGGVAVWPRTDRVVRIMTGHTGKVLGLAFGLDGSWLASSSMDGTIRRWAMRAGGSQPVQIIVKDGTTFMNLVVDDSGRFLFSGGDSGNLPLVPIGCGQPMTFKMDTQAWSVAVSPDGELVAAAARGLLRPDHTYVRVWRTDTGKLVRTVDSGEPAWGLHLLRNGDLLTCGETGLLRWDLKTGESEAVIAGAVHCVGQVVSSDGRRLLYYDTVQLNIVDLETGATRALPAFRPFRLFHDVQIKALSRSGKIVVSAAGDGAIEVGLADGGEPHLLLGHTGYITALAIDPTGRWIASASDENLRLWPMPDLSQPPLYTLPKEELLAKLRQLTNLRVVPDGSSPDGFRLDVGPFPGWRTMPPSW